ncbi:hypothetical protein SNOG_05456 [Parastagonospora nodorum SN15]|uniref:Uncharacterized protein n=1 Tax=Phaeosphaeria nodorum (strain SN15 / ATCC MYA-4574 / FGSC 10173) TaxID=321614 RepID=Q0US08_PHANO|nr:hypothetical protein SNOG_05456 [Parastagonospora nodorum SN15]EAT86520.1 hypothetical protein SNOG_05456 [Parastagonospora nodorum SN15]
MPKLSPPPRKAFKNIWVLLRVCMDEAAVRLNNVKVDDVSWMKPSREQKNESPPAIVFSASGSNRHDFVLNLNTGEIAQVDGDARVVDVRTAWHRLLACAANNETCCAAQDTGSDYVHELSNIDPGAGQNNGSWAKPALQ